MYANSVNKRLPMSPDLARDILMLHYVPGRAWDGLSILELRFVAFFLVLYFACARYKEAARIKMENIRVTNSGNVMILFYKAKNNQFGYQRAAYILLSGHKYLCPVLILRTYLEKLVAAGGSRFLFTSFDGEGNILPDSTFSYDNAKHFFKNALVRVGVEEAELGHYGLHSNHIGAATSASNNLSELELQRSGRWQDPNSAKGYVCSSEKSLSKMSKVLNKQMSKRK